MKVVAIRVFLLCLSLLLCHAVGAEPLPANEAFKLEVKSLDANTLSLHWNIASGYFLYQERIHLNNLDKENILNLGTLHFPKPQNKIDSQGKSIPIYHNNLTVQAPILGTEAGEVLVTLDYQGCSDEGFCYPPEKRLIKMTINRGLELSAAEIYTTDSKNSTKNVSKTRLSSSPQNAITSNTDSIESTYQKHHWLMTLLIFYGFGLLLAFTPCVLPMVPVLSGIIIGHGHNISTTKAFFLSLAYVFSMAITYAIAGALVATLGANLQISLQSSWVITLFSLVFVVLAASMFGFFELKFPTSWQAKLAMLNRSQASGHYLSAAIMGALSTLILSPCVTAPLIGALSYIARSGDIVMGAATLFALGLGMGTPLLLIGTSARHWLPQVGHWMNAVKFFFGILLLAVAIYLLSRIIPAGITMTLWASILIFSGVFSGAFQTGESALAKCQQAFGLILLVYGLLILIGTSMGSTNPLQPLSALAIKPAYNTTSFATSTVTNLPDLNNKMQAARGKPILLDFYASWCESCKSIENNAFQDPRVLKALEQFVIIKVDVTENTEQSQALLKKFKVIAPPTFLWFNRSGQELKSLQLVGSVSSEHFIRNAAKVN